MRYFDFLLRGRGAGADLVPRAALVVVLSFALVGPAGPAHADENAVPPLVGPESFADAGGVTNSAVGTEGAARSFGFHGPRCGDGVLDPGEICEPFEWVWVSIHDERSLEFPLPRFNPCCSFRCDFRPAGTSCGGFHGDWNDDDWDDDGWDNDQGENDQGENDQGENDQGGDGWGGPRSIPHRPPGCEAAPVCDGAGLCVADDASVCDDDNPCTQDLCVSRCSRKNGSCKKRDPDGCVHVPIDCDDGMACTVDRCDVSTGQCTHEPSDLDCDDGLACTVDRCDAATGACVHEPQHRFCDNGLFCDGEERCDPRVASGGGAATDIAPDGCVAGEPARCDDRVECTNDRCDENLDRCLHAPSDALCDNGLFCDGSEVCLPPSGPRDRSVSGCEQGSAPVCDDQISCTRDVCDERVDSCVHEPVNLLCDDGQFCNGDEVCDAQRDCVAGEPVRCDDGVDCTSDRCDEALDSCVVTPDDSVCDDGIFCNGVEQCLAADRSTGVFDCQRGPAPSCDDGVGCTVDSCADETDACQNVADHSRCDNSLFCDGVETCHAVNDCVAGVPMSCENDATQCTEPLCDEALDACVDAPTNESLPCDDGSLCTKGETCTSGECGGGAVGVLGAACDWVAVGEGDERVRFRGGNQTVVRGDVCMDTELVGTGSFIDGNIVATGEEGDKVLTFGFGSAVSGDVVTGGGGVQGQLGATLPHLAMGTSQVPAGTVQPMEAPATGQYDTTGLSPLVGRCVAARANLAAVEAAILDVVDPSSPGYQGFDAVRVRQGRGSFDVVAPVPGGLNVAHFSMLALGSGAEMQLDGGGDENTVMVVVVDGRFSARANARVELAGGLQARNVILFSGGDRKCQLGSFSSFRGTIFCPNARLRVLAGSRVEGAVLAGDAKLQIGDEAVLDYQPFTGF